MGLNLTNINQRPYIKDDRRLVKKKQDEEASKSAAQTEREEQAQNQNSRSRGLSYVEQEAPKYQEIKPEQWQQMYAKTQASHQKSQTAASSGIPGENSRMCGGTPRKSAVHSDSRTFPRSP